MPGDLLDNVLGWHYSSNNAPFTMYRGEFVDALAAVTSAFSR